MGIACKLMLTCTRCKHKEESYTSKWVHQSMDVNRRMVMAMRLTGCGREPLQQFCGTMNIPVSLSTGCWFYPNHVAALLKAAKEEAERG